MWQERPVLHVARAYRRAQRSMAAWLAAGIAPWVLVASGCTAQGRPAASAGPGQGVRSARIERDVERLAAFGTRHTLSDTASDVRGIGAARRWLLAELEAISREHHGGRLSCALVPHWVEPSERVPLGAEVVNVVAELRGSDPERLIVVSGHYDSRAGDPMDADSDAPGANDDASGTAVVLECARALAGLEPRATVVFLCVAGEEQGLLGARAQAQAWKAAGRHVEAFMTNDIVGGARGSNGRREPLRLRLFSEGRPSAGRVVGSDNDAPSRQLARYLEEVGEAAVPGLDVELVFRQDRFLRGGDHRPFNDEGFAGVRFTEPNENYDRQHQDVRVEDGVQYGDLARFVDFDYVARVATVNAAGLRALALAPRPPQDVAMDVSELSPDTRLTWRDDPRAAGWRVRLRRTSEPTWSAAIDVGRSTGATLEGYSKDDWLFAVEAYAGQLGGQGGAGQTSLPVYPGVE